MTKESCTLNPRMLEKDIIVNEAVIIVHLGNDTDKSTLVFTSNCWIRGLK